MVDNTPGVLQKVGNSSGFVHKSLAIIFFGSSTYRNCKKQMPRQQ